MLLSRSRRSHGPNKKAWLASSTFDAAFLRVQHKIHHHHCLLYHKKCSGIPAAHTNAPRRENPTSHKITKSGNKFQLVLPHHIRSVSYKQANEEDEEIQNLELRKRLRMEISYIRIFLWIYILWMHDV
jgi:hypothetical protein